MNFVSAGRLFAPAFLIVVLSACNGSGGGTSSVQTAPPDQNFVTGATQASNAEIGAAKLAVAKSTNTDVVAFANEMINQHTQEEQALAPIAASANYRVPGPTSLNATQQQQAATLQAATEPAFDAIYINGEITGHQDNIANNYNPEIASGYNAQVVNYAKTYLPQVTMHLQMAQSIKAKYGY